MAVLHADLPCFLIESLVPATNRRKNESSPLWPHIPYAPPAAAPCVGPEHGFLRSPRTSQRGHRHSLLFRSLLVHLCSQLETRVERAFMMRRRTLMTREASHEGFQVPTPPHPLRSNRAIGFSTVREALSPLFIFLIVLSSLAAEVMECGPTQILIHPSGIVSSSGGKVTEESVSETRTQGSYSYASSSFSQVISPKP